MVSDRKRRGMQFTECQPPLPHSSRQYFRQICENKENLNLGAFGQDVFDTQSAINAIVHFVSMLDCNSYKSKLDLAVYFMPIGPGNRIENRHCISSSITVKRVSPSRNSGLIMVPKGTNHQARVLVERQLEEAERLEMEAIVNVRASKKQEKQVRGANPPQIPVITIRKPSSAPGKALSYRSSGKAVEAKAPASSSQHHPEAKYSNRTSAPEEPSTKPERLSKRPKILTEHVDSNQSTTKYRLPSRKAKKSEPTTVSSRVSHVFKDKEILYDFTDSKPSTAQISSVQSDIFTDGSMLSPKAKERDVSLPSSMDLDDGVLYDMRSTPGSQGSSESEKPKCLEKKIEYAPPSYASGSDDVPGLPNAPSSKRSTNPRIETRSRRSEVEPDYIPLIPKDKKEREQENRQWQEMKDKEGKGQKRKRDGEYKEQKQKQGRNHGQKQEQNPTPSFSQAPRNILETPPPQRSSIRFTAMREQMLSVQKQLETAQKQMQTILPILEGFVGDMATPETSRPPSDSRCPSTMNIKGQRKIAGEDRGKNISRTAGGGGNPQQEKKIKKTESSARAAQAYQEAPREVTRFESVILGRAEQLVPSIEVDDDSGIYEDVFGNESVVKTEIESSSDGYEPSTPISSNESPLPERPIEKMRLFGDWVIKDFSHVVDSKKKRQKIDTPTSNEASSSRRLKSDPEKVELDVNEAKSIPTRAKRQHPTTSQPASRVPTETRKRIYTPSSASSTPPPQDYLQYGRPTNRKIGEGIKPGSGPNMRLITPITILNKSASISPAPTPKSSRPTNPKLQQVKTASEISPTTIPLSDISPSKRRVYTPSSIASEAASSHETSSPMSHARFSNIDPFESGGTEPEAKKVFRIKRICAPATIATPMPPPPAPINDLYHANGCLGTDIETVRTKSERMSPDIFRDSEVPSIPLRRKTGALGRTRLYGYGAENVELEEGFLYDFSKL